jgi:hypothetical protein
MWVMRLLRLGTHREAVCEGGGRFSWYPLEGTRDTPFDPHLVILHRCSDEGVCGLRISSEAGRDWRGWHIRSGCGCCGSRGYCYCAPLAGRCGRTQGGCYVCIYTIPASSSSVFFVARLREDRRSRGLRCGL